MRIDIVAKMGCAPQELSDCVYWWIKLMFSDDSSESAKDTILRPEENKLCELIATEDSDCNISKSIICCSWKNY